MKKITLIIAITFFISSNAQNVTTNGTILLDDATSRTRVVVDAFLNSSNRVHELIEEIAPSYGGDFTTNNTVLVNTIETVSPKTSLEPATNYTDLVADNITNLLISAIDKKADKERDCRVIGSVVVPERISGDGWSHALDRAAADVGELTYNGCFSEQEGVVVWTGTAPYTIEESTFYTWAIAVYDAFGGTFVGYCSAWNESADIEYDIGGMVSNSFTSVLGLSWQDSFATLNTPEPDALNWGNVEGIAMLGQITVSTSVTGVEHVVYSGELQSATNGVMNVVTNEIPAHFTDWVAPNPFSNTYYYAPSKEWIEAYGETTSEYYTVSIGLIVPSEGLWNVYAESYLFQNGEWGVWITTDKDIYAPSNTETLVVERFLDAVASATFTRELIPAKNALGLARLTDIAPTVSNTVTKSYVESLGIESGVDAQTVTNMTALTPVYSQTPTFSEWVLSGDYVQAGWHVVLEGYDQSSEKYGWQLVDGNGEFVSDVLAPFDAMTLFFDGVAVTATRTRTDIIGYTLGGQTNSVLTATNSLISASTITNIASDVSSSAIASADTTYRRTIGLTNLNQSVQYVNITDTAPTTLSISMPTDGATKDWMVYVVSVTNVTLSLPAATWWMADVAYTNDVPPATPTALWFSQVTDGIFILGRQELTEVTAP